MSVKKSISVSNYNEFSEIYKEKASSALSGDSRFLSEDIIKLMFEIYVRLVCANSKFNLTSITDCTDVIERHIIDSLIPLMILDTKNIILQNTKILDIGAGAGFPSLPLAAAADSGFNNYSIHAIDSTAKKIQHIKDTAETLGLRSLTAETGRAEDLAFGALRESFDIVIARAVSSMPILIELSAPFVKVGGTFAAMKAHADEEIKAASSGAKKLGFELPEIVRYSLPGGDVRSLVIYKKTSKTPGAYPRQYSKILHSPL